MAPCPAAFMDNDLNRLHEERQDFAAEPHAYSGR
jgi:hypothetical protein